MEIIQQGGVMMWPLIAMSIFALAIIIERLLFYSSFVSFLRIKTSEITNSFLSPEDANEQKCTKEILKEEDFAPILNYKKILLQKQDKKTKEMCLYNEGQAILAKCNYGLDMLSTIVRSAPLMGLLGTVIGMIDTFSTLELNQSGVDISILAGGIWQALITTATGLVISLFALFAHQYFIGRKKKILHNLEVLARIFLALDSDKAQSNIE